MAKLPGVRRSTKAYENFKDQMDALWNFGVMICYAVPTLKKNIKAVTEGIHNYSIPKNELFAHDTSSPQEIRGLTEDYKFRLTSYLWLSSFSFFEAFVSGALQELIRFSRWRIGIHRGGRTARSRGSGEETSAGRG